MPEELPQVQGATMTTARELPQEARRDPFKIIGPTCISFSGGRTSAYMLWRVLQSNGGLPDEAVVCFANTGKEEEATLRFVRDCGERWNVPIRWVEYRPNGAEETNFEAASRNGEPFEMLIAKKKYLPNPVARFCSMELKNGAIGALTGISDEDTMVGVRADEPSRIAKMRRRGLQTPLFDAGVTKADVRTFWKMQPFDLELQERDGQTRLGNCDLCFLKSFDAIYGNIAEKPERATWWAKQEEKIAATFRSDRPSYAQMLRNAQSQIDFIGHEDEGIPCFCGD